MCGLLTIVCIFVFNFFKMCLCSIFKFNQKNLNDFFFFQYNQKCFLKNNKCVCVLYFNLTKKKIKRNFFLGQSGFEPGCHPCTKCSKPLGYVCVVVILQQNARFEYEATQFCGASFLACATEYDISVAHPFLHAPQKCHILWRIPERMRHRIVWPHILFNDIFNDIFSF